MSQSGTSNNVSKNIMQGKLKNNHEIYHRIVLLRLSRVLNVLGTVQKLISGRAQV